MIHFTTKCDDEIYILETANKRLLMENTMLKERHAGEIACLLNKIAELKVQPMHFDPTIIGE